MCCQGDLGAVPVWTGLGIGVETLRVWRGSRARGGDFARRTTRRATALYGLSTLAVVRKLVPVRAAAADFYSQIKTQIPSSFPTIDVAQGGVRPSLAWHRTLHRAKRKLSSLTRESRVLCTAFIKARRPAQPDGFGCPESEGGRSSAHVDAIVLTSPASDPAAWSGI